MAITVRYELTPDDIEAEYGRKSMAQWLRERRKYRLWGLGFVLFGTVLLAWVIISRAVKNEEWPFAAGLFLPIVLFGWCVLLRAVRPRRRIAVWDPWYLGLWERYRCGVHEVTATEDCLVDRMKSAEISMSWQLVLDVEEGQEHLFLDRRGTAVLTIPKRAFATPDEAAEFVGFARACSRAAGGDAVARLRNYVAQRDVPCPKCGYNLRGTAGEGCPECGREITVEELYFEQMSRE